jgi:hypothetical protein
MSGQSSVVGEKHAKIPEFLFSVIEPRFLWLEFIGQRIVCVCVRVKYCA